MAAADPYLASLPVADVSHAEGGRMASHTPESTAHITSENGETQHTTNLYSHDETLDMSTISHDSKVMRVGRRARPSIQVMNFDSPEDEHRLPAQAKPSKPTLDGLFCGNGLASAFGASEEPAVVSPNSITTSDKLMHIDSGIHRSVTPLSQIAHASSIERPTSALSDASTSSSSSDDSTPGHPEDMFSNAGDTNSPATEAPTPRGTMYGRKIAAALTYGRYIPQLHPRQPKRIPATFTTKMDQHLWNCMLKDMADFKNAPYRMSEGQPPPTGVQCRVAEEAKRSWRSDITDGASGPRLAWPALKHTRARLRQLSREQYRLTTADLRRVRACSPTPEQGVLDQLQVRQGLRERSRRRTYAYNMRDVRVSLFSQTAQSMRPGGPLNQLHTQSDSYFQNLAPWFENGRGAALSGSGQFGAALQPSPAPLGAPFSHQAKTWTSGMARQHAAAAVAQPQPQRPFATLNRLHGLEPAIALDDGERQRSSNKRSAPFSTEDAGPRDREGPRTPPAPTDQASSEETRRRVRPRGLTLEDIFVPRTETSHFGSDGANDVRPFSASTMPAPQMSGLGSSTLRSPFDGIASRPTRARAVPRPAAALTIFSGAEGGPSIDARIANSSDTTSGDVTSSAPKADIMPAGVDGVDERDLAMDTSQ